MREPISEIFDAARFLDAAVSAHLVGRTPLAEELIHLTNTSTLREYIDSLWRDTKRYLIAPRPRGAVPAHPVAKVDAREPSISIKRELVKRDGYLCRFCGIPVIPPEVRERMAKAYPDALPWPKKTSQQHSAFQVLWLQFDHIVPHARGGDNSLGNLVVACAGCNFSRMSWTLEEVGLLDPREREPVKSTWDGLTRFR